MAKGSSGTENINHFAAVRLRVSGSGNLKCTVASLSGVKTQVVTPIVMADPTDIEPYRLVNFVTQRATFRFEVTEVGEYFIINTLVIFLKNIFTQYPS